jgi:hypothetical protein
MGARLQLSIAEFVVMTDMVTHTRPHPIRLMHPLITYLALLLLLVLTPYSLVKRVTPVELRRTLELHRSLAALPIVCLLSSSVFSDRFL